MNKHERKRLTDATILILNGLITTTGNRTAGHDGQPGGIPVVVPDQTARDIRAIARDVLGHGARKARLNGADPYAEFAPPIPEQGDAPEWVLL